MAGTSEPLVANDLLEDKIALRQQMERDGYLFLRGFCDRDLIHQIQLQVLEICRDAGLLLDNSLVEEAKVSTSRTQVPHALLQSVQRKLFGLEIVHVWFHSPAITNIMQAIVGEPTVPHVHKQVRIQFPVEPGKPPQTTAAHQDFVYNQGTTACYTCWVPLGDLPQEFGGLQVLAGSHRQGVYRVHAPSDGSITYHINDAELSGDWICPEYQMGDAILFHSLTVHRATENRSRSLRISMDCRYQGISQPFSEKLMEPLPGVEEAYAGWKSKELQYYWQRLDLKTVGHDLSYFDKIDKELRER